MLQKNGLWPVLPLKDSTNSPTKPRTCIIIDDDTETPIKDPKLSGNWNLLVMCDDIKSISIPRLISEEQIYAEIRNTTSRGFWYRHVCRQQRKITEQLASTSLADIPSSSSMNFGASYDDYYASIIMRRKRRSNKIYNIDRTFSACTDNLEETIVKMKHRLAISFHQRDLPYFPTNISCPRLNHHPVNILSSITKHHRGSNELLHGSDCLVFEFFDVVAPLIPGKNFIDYSAGEAPKHRPTQNIWEDSLTNFVCCVNGKKNVNSHIVEYWVPRSDTKRFDELYIVVNARFQSLADTIVALQSNSMSPLLSKNGMCTRRKHSLTDYKFEDGLKRRKKNGITSRVQKSISPLKSVKDEKETNRQIENPHLALNGLIKRVPGKRGRKRKVVEKIETVTVDSEESYFSANSKTHSVAATRVRNTRRSVTERSQLSASLSPLKLSSSSECVYLSDDEDDVEVKVVTKALSPSKNTRKSEKGSSPLKVNSDNSVNHRFTRHERSKVSPVKQEKSFFGAKLIGKWKDTRINLRSKREFHPSYGNSGIIMVNETDNTCMAWRDSVGRLIPSHQLIEQIQHLSKKSVKGGYTNLRVELSNEHGFGDILDKDSLATSIIKANKLNTRLTDRRSSNLLKSVQRCRGDKSVGTGRRISPRKPKEVSPAMSSASVASTASAASAISNKQRNVPSCFAANGVEKTNTKTKLDHVKRSDKLSYVDGVQKKEFTDLFYDILPYVGPTYTPLEDPPLPNLIGVDTNQGWLVNMSEARLNEFLDVSPVEKAFFVIWNSFTMRRVNRTVGRVGLPLLLERFVDEFGEEVVRRNMIFNFVSHCACLCKCGHISQSQMYDAIFLLEKFKL